MDKKDLCLEIAEKYNDFRQIEKAWRVDFDVAKIDKAARQRAYSGMKELQKAFEPVEELVGCSYENAKELLKEGFFGVEDLEKAFGFKPNINIPKIKFTVSELKEAQEHGEILMLRIGQDNEGRPMTMKKILEIIAPRMPKGEKLLAYQKNINLPELKDSLWDNEKCFNDESLKTEWVLIGKEFSPRTLNNNYARQTMELYNELRKRRLLSAKELKENAGLEQKLKVLCEKMGVNWETQKEESSAKFRENRDTVAKELAELAINQKHRRSGVGIVFDWAVRFLSRMGDRGQLGGRVTDWSNSIGPTGICLAIGGFNPDGGHIDWYHPGFRYTAGAVLLRSRSDRKAGFSS
jgi:hypothetical protein